MKTIYNFTVYHDIYLNSSRLVKWGNYKTDSQKLEIQVYWKLFVERF